VDLCSADPVADVLARIFKRDKVTSWRGTASDLCKVALQLEKDGQQLPADFPRSAGRLGDHLRRRSSVIKRFGFDVQRERTTSSRLLDIKLSTPATPEKWLAECVGQERSPRGADSKDGQSEPKPISKRHLHKETQ